MLQRCCGCLQVVDALEDELKKIMNTRDIVQTMKVYGD